RLACELGAQHFYCDFAFEHQVDALEHRTHPTFTDLLGDFIAAYYITYHQSVSAVRVSGIGRSAGSPAAIRPTIPTVMLSCPPRSFARAMRFSQAVGGALNMTICFISSSSTRSYRPSEHKRKRSPALTGKGSCHVVTSTSAWLPIARRMTFFSG